MANSSPPYYGDDDIESQFEETKEIRNSIVVLIALSSLNGAMFKFESLNEPSWLSKKVVDCIRLDLSVVSFWNKKLE